MSEHYTMLRKVFRALGSQKFCFEIVKIGPFISPKNLMVDFRFGFGPKKRPPLTLLYKYFFLCILWLQFFFESLYMDVSNNFALCLNAIRCLENFLEQFEMKSFGSNPNLKSTIRFLGEMKGPILTISSKTFHFKLL